MAEDTVEMSGQRIDEANPSVEHLTAEDPEPPPQYPTGARLLLITIGLILSIFIAALDSTIIATAIPSITSEFGSISNIAWYGTSYSITNCAFQSCWGKAYKYFSLKKAFFLAILIFEIGNVISALAPNSAVLIFGRIVAGTGGGGVMTGAFIIIALTAGPKYRAAYMGVLGVTFGCASVVGPIMGGALTDGPGWRWCFWISLPIGLAAILTMAFSLNIPLIPIPASLPQKLLNLDLTGALLISGALSTFVLFTHNLTLVPLTTPLQITTLTTTLLLTLLFLLNEHLLGPLAMLQKSLLFSPTTPIPLNTLYVFFLAGTYFPLLYTLPIQFQSLSSTSASESGIRLIPLVLGISLFTMLANAALTFLPLSRTPHRYKPWFLIGAVLATAGNAKIYGLDGATSSAAWVGWEILTAAGVGLALQIPMMANQSVVGTEDLGAVTSLSLFAENLGTVLSVAVSEAAFTSGLVRGVRRAWPGVDVGRVLEVGATDLRGVFRGHELEGVLGGYLEGCQTSHLVAVVAGGLTGVVSLFITGPMAAGWVRGWVKKAHER